MYNSRPPSAGFPSLVPTVPDFDGKEDNNDDDELQGPREWSRRVTCTSSSNPAFARGY